MAKPRSAQHRGADRCLHARVTLSIQGTARKVSARLNPHYLLEDKVASANRGCGWTSTTILSVEGCGATSSGERILQTTRFTRISQEFRRSVHYVKIPGSISISLRTLPSPSLRNQTLHTGTSCTVTKVGKFLQLRVMLRCLHHICTADDQNPQ